MADCKAGSSVCEASSRVFFCEGDRGLSWLRARCFLTMCVCHCSELHVWLTARLVLPYVKLVAACSSVKAREVCHGCELGAIWGYRLTTKRTRKNSSREGQGINALCLEIDRCIAESLGGGIDSRKEINLWLLHILIHQGSILAWIYTQ